MDTQKNIRQFLGKQILSYSIEAAQQAGIFYEIVFSTEDEEIVCTASQYGVVVPFLPSQKMVDD